MNMNRLTESYFPEKHEYVCDKCGKNFYLGSRLRKHMLKHSDNRNYECEVCGKRFEFSSKSKEN